MFSMEISVISEVISVDFGESCYPLMSIFSHIGYPKVRKGVFFAKRSPFREKDPIFTKRALFIISTGNTDIYLKWHVYECYKKCLSNIFLVNSQI